MKFLSKEGQDKTCESIQFNIKEGCSYSVIGSVMLTEHGMQLNNLVAVIAGGLFEAKRFLNAHIKYNMNWATIYGILGINLICLPLLYFGLSALIKRQEKKDEKKWRKN